jgi:Kip1 ubiquitination-promoting complex protein 1
MQSLEKISRPMILAPLIGIVINLAAAPLRYPGLQHDIVRALASADASAGSSANFDYLLDFNWSDSFKGDPSLHRVAELKSFVRRYKQVRAWAALAPALFSSLYFVSDGGKKS